MGKAQTKEEARIDKALEQTFPASDPPNAFMHDVLAPLIVPGMKIYDELKQEVFGGAPKAG